MPAKPASGKRAWGRAGRGAPAVRPNDIALIAVCATIFLLALAALVAVGVASFLFGGGWTWPRSVAGTASELGGLLTGRAGHGLDPADARRLPGTAALWTVIVLVELAALATAILVARWAAETVRPPPAASGLATKAEAKAALGERRRPIRRLLLRPVTLLAERADRAERAERAERADRADRAERADRADGAERADRAERGDPGGQDRSEPTSWPLGRSRRPRGVDLRVPFTRSTGVLGRPETDLAVQAALAAPGALVHATARADDVLLTLSRRERDGRPVAVLDPRGMLPGLPSLAWDPLHGCVDAAVATRRATAFTAGTVLGAAEASGDEVAARTSAAQAAKVLQCYLHAAALTGRTLDHVMDWVADPAAGRDAETILTEHPHAEPHWAALLRGAGAPDGTLQRSMDAFLHSEITKRCLPGRQRPATDIADVLRNGGTIYLLGKDDPYATVSPLLTAVADDVLAAGPPLVILDDVGVAPVPRLPQHPDGTCFVWTAPAQRQLVTCYGDAGARAIVASTDVMVYPDGDGLEPGDVSVVARPCPPIVARLSGSATEGRLADLEQARQRAAAPQPPWYAQRDPARSALTAAHEHGLHPDSWQRG